MLEEYGYTCRRAINSRKRPTAPVNDESPFDENSVPEPNPEVDVDSLSEPPSADDFFLYERIDGSTSVEELCTVSGLGRDETLAGLERLCETGLVEIPGYEAESGGADDSTDEAPDATSGDDGGSSGIDLSHLPTPPEDFDYDGSALEADVPLDETMKRELICLSEQLDSLDHYQFFGVDRDASQKAIKMAYFRLSKRYHPDKHFGDEIGPFEEMLEDIFQRVTKAYRTLSDPDNREAYDEELAERDADEATPMNRPSSVRMAREEEGAEEAGDGGGGGVSTDTGKRKAAFAKLLKKGERHRKQGDYLDAADAYRKALGLRRELNVALQAARVLLRADKQHDQAELFARAGLRIDDSSVEAYLTLGRALEKQNRAEEARDAYESALDLEPEHPKAQTRLSTLEAG